MGKIFQADEIGWPVEIVKERRRTFSITLQNGIVVAKVPSGASHDQIRSFLLKHRRWIRTHGEKAARSLQAAREAGPLSAEDLRTLARQAAEIIPQRVRYYASLMGVTYGRITIRNQKSRWGSCSQAGNLNFNCLLMLCPPEVVDAIVVHELAHRKEMNHSPRFYREIEKVYPDYEKWNRWLKDNGGILLTRASQETIL